MAIPSSLITLLLGMALALVGLWIGQNVNLLPLDASSNAPVYDALFQVLFIIGTILFIGIVGLVVYSLIRFRRRPGDLGDGPPTEGNLPLEILWTAIPAVVVLFIGIYSYDIYDRMGGMTPLNDHSLHQHTATAVQQASTTSPDGEDPEERIWAGIGPAKGSGDALQVDVTAMQFAFLFHYPEGDFISGELHIPEGREVELRMQAKDVIHAFWVPQFRLKQDVIPGQTTVLSLTATRTGTYPIVCAELCGPYHGGMRSSVVVHDADDFDAWLQRNSPTPVAATTVASSGAQPTA